MIKQRDYYFDNVKFLLIVLVVFGHAIFLIKNPTFALLYKLVYLFHIPCFVLVAGYFTKQSGKTSVGVTLVQFGIFQFLYYLFGVHVLQKEAFVLQFTQPNWILWFLFSTLCWKILLPYVLRLKHPLILTVGVALLAGYDVTVGYRFSFSRTLVFFPFFLLGYFANKSWVHMVKKGGPIPPIAGFVCFFMLLRVAPAFSTSLFYGSEPYKTMHFTAWYAGIWRLVAMASAFVLLVCFFALVPLKQTWYSRFGSRTLQVFLLHGFVIQYLKFRKIGDFLTTPMAKTLYLLAVFALVLLLSLKPVTTLFSPLLNPQWLLRRLVKTSSAQAAQPNG